MQTDQQDYMKAQIRENMQLKETAELLEIWRRNDHEEWTDLAFEVIRDLLTERLGEIPAEEPKKKAPWVMRSFHKPHEPEGQAPSAQEIQDFVWQQTYESMDGMGTDELIDIWQTADHEQWTDQAFEAIKQILTDRIGQAPGQAPEPSGDEPDQEVDATEKKPAAVEAPEEAPLGGLMGLRCPDCGKAIEEKDEYCPHCGVNLDAPLSETELQALGTEQLEKAQKIYDQGHKFADALEECDLALEYLPDSAQAHNLRGLILDALEKTGLAVKEYREALRLDPGLTEARDNLADAEAELKSRKF